MQQDPEQRRRVRSGFTLVELLLVVTILGVLATVVVMNTRGISEKSRISATRASIDAISTAVGTFDATKSRLPESLDELTAESADAPALLDKGKLNDAWGTPFQYKKISKFKFEVRSAGPDAAMGTEDDLTN
jgi:general secretion pathway protein G